MADNVARRANAEANRAKAAAEQARAEAAKAAAEQARIGAEIAKAEAEARAAAAASAAQLERTRVEGQLAAAAAERQAAADAAKAVREERARAEAEATKAWERGYQTAVQVGAVGLGAYGGHKLAHRIEARHVTHLAAVAPQLSSLGTKTERLLRPGRGGAISAASRTKLAGIVTAADRAGLTRIRGPLGAVTAGLLLSEGLFSRFVVAPQLQESSPATAEIARQASTASIFAASTLIGERMLQNRTLAKLPPTKGIASIEAARRVVGTAPPAVATGTVRAAQRTMAKLQAATSTAAMVRSGVLNAVGGANVATARRLGARAGALGTVAALGIAAVQTEAAQSAWAWVTGHYRTGANGRTAYVQPYQRRVG
jgi:hypothetical protein